jgi:hypothetical protein
VREDYVCSDVSQYDRLEYTVPGKMPLFGVESLRGCPWDCGLCTEHEQHTCVGVLEITSSCNLTCPMCYAHSGPSGKHLSYEECVAAIDRLVETEGRPEVLQLSGGEPTIHPQFLEVLDYGCHQPIDVVMINTNGIRLAHDLALVQAIAEHGPRVEVYFQLDGFDDDVNCSLRGEPLLATKLKALENLGQKGIRVTLVTTLQPKVNLDQVGRIVRFGLERPWITGLSLQPATYSGRFVLPEDLEQRVTFPDVIRVLVEQTDGLFRTDDFLPLPCAHPNCHSLAYVYRSPGGPVPLTRIIDARQNADLLANGILFTRPKARQLIEQYLARMGVGCCGGSGCCDGDPRNTQQSENGLPMLGFTGASANGAGGLNFEALDPVAAEFFSRAMAEQLSSADVFRITITSFLDAYNFDIRRLMKCCIHHVLSSGHIVPFCAYNVLYRDGHARLPTLRSSKEQLAARN